MEYMQPFSWVKYRFNLKFNKQNKYCIIPELRANDQRRDQSDEDNGEGSWDLSNPNQL